MKNKIKIPVDTSLLQKKLRISRIVNIISITVAVFLLGLFEFPRIYFSLNTYEQLFSAPISNKDDINKIVNRIKQERVKVKVSRNGIIKVKDENIAKRIRTILVREDLIPYEFLNGEFLISKNCHLLILNEEFIFKDQ